MSLSKKPALAFMALLLLSITIPSIYSFYSLKQALIQSTFDQLSLLRKIKQDQVENFFSDREKDISQLASQDWLTKLAENKKEETECIVINTNICPVGCSIYLYSSVRSWIGINQETPDQICIRELIPEETNKLNQLFTHPVQSEDTIFTSYPNNQDSGYVFLATHTRDRKNSQNGFLILSFPLSSLRFLLTNNPSMGEPVHSAEVILVDQYNNLLTSTCYQSPDNLKPQAQAIISTDSNYWLNRSNILMNHRGEKVLCSCGPLKIPFLLWNIRVESAYQTVMQPFVTIRIFFSVFFLIIFILCLILIRIFSERIDKPLVRLTDAVIKAGHGIYTFKLQQHSNDEIGTLIDAFNHMIRQFEEKTLELSQERYGKLRSFIDGEEIARQRVSRELHDGIGQSLSAMKLRIDALQYISAEELKVHILKINRQFDQIVDETRRISNNLMPSVLEAFGIIIALRNLCVDTREQTGIRIQYDFRGDCESLNATIQTYLYRITQEALNNIVKHAHATSVQIHLEKSDNYVTLSITDNGIGFNSGDLLSQMGHGISNMKDRVSLLKGTIEIQSSPGRGTQINIGIKQN